MENKRGFISFPPAADTCQGLPALPDPKILAVVEYDKSSGEAAIDVRCNGDPLDPASGGNKLAYMLLRSTVSEMSDTPIREDGYHNRVHIVIR